MQNNGTTKKTSQPPPTKRRCPSPQLATKQSQGPPQSHPKPLPVKPPQPIQKPHLIQPPQSQQSPTRYDHFTMDVDDEDDDDEPSVYSCTEGVDALPPSPDAPTKIYLGHKWGWGYFA